jgi:hypothetical protein
MAGLISPIADLEQQNIDRQMAYADALRKKGMQTDGQMVGRIYVAKNPWQNFLESAFGSGIASNQQQQAEQLRNTRQQQRNQLLSSMPSEYTQAEVQQSTPEQQFGPTQAPVEQTTVQRPLREYTDAMNRWSLQAANVPGMEGVAGFGLQQSLAAPEKRAAAEEARKQRVFEMTQKAIEARQTQQERLDAIERENQRNRDARRDMVTLAASLRPAPAPHTAISYDKEGNGYLVDLRTGGETPLEHVGKTPPGAGGRGGKGPTPEQAKAYELESLDELIRRTKELKGSPGLSTVTGPVAGRLPGAAFMTNQDASNAVSTYDKYMEFLQTKGLQDLKARGISPGSVTEKEWPKFVARLTSLDRVKGGKEVNSELDRMMVDAYNTRAKVSGTGDTFHNVDGRIYRLPTGADPKRKSSYEEVQ